MSETRLCYWCHDPLPALPEDASYVDEINHYAHEACREERDEKNRRLKELRAGIVAGTIDSIPEVVRQAVLDRIKTSGFSRRCPLFGRPNIDKLRTKGDVKGLVKAHWPTRWRK